MNHTHTYIDPETGVEVKVYPPQPMPAKKSRPYVSMKERDQKILQSHLKQAFCMNAYDAAVTFGMQREEAESVTETTTGFESALRRERANFNRRKA
ncbi:hypothetical protein [Vibrio fluvialis]|uniref:hypothetical protein n=1 Tax=Vibrio fluvialis TaxID=676 RepID=UPI003D14CC01